MSCIDLLQLPGREAVILLIPKSESCFYASADGEKSTDPIISLNMMWADGLSASCCGFTVDGKADERTDTDLWDHGAMHDETAPGFRFNCSFLTVVLPDEDFS